MRFAVPVVSFCALACTGTKAKIFGTADGGAAASAGSSAPASIGEKDGAKRGGYVVVTSPEPVTLNPITSAAFDVATPLIFDGLAGLDARGELVPVLAEKWSRSPDGKVLTFNLRKNVTWHDGKPFTSADVTFTIDVIRKGQTPTLWAAYLASLEKVEAPDEHTVVVTWRESYGPDVASFIFGILPKHVFEGQDVVRAPANNSPVGTGAFKFVRWSSRKNMVLAANETYWAGRPNLDRIEIVFDLRPRDHLRALSERKLDFTEITEPAEWSGQLRTPEFLEKFETGTLDENVLTLIAWNNQKKPFDDKRVRQALTMALDRPRVIEDVLLGAARPVSGPFFPTMWGADPNIAPRPFDLHQAGALLDLAKLPAKDGKRFSVELLVQDSFRGSSVYDQMLAIFDNDMEKIGVELRVTYIPRAEVVDRLRLHEFDAVLFRWTSDIPDPDPYALLHSSQINGGENYVGFVNPEADRLLEAGRRAQDRAQRKESYYALHRLVLEEQPFTFLFAPQRFYAWSRRVHGVSPLDLSALPRWPGVAGWWVDN
jgi:peptide/nickel transport system substrate-binding protein